MSKTSTAVKQRYLDKTYKQWSVRLKPDLYELVEKARGELSRAEFLAVLVEKYCSDTQEH